MNQKTAERLLRKIKMLRDDEPLHAGDAEAIRMIDKIINSALVRGRIEGLEWVYEKSEGPKNIYDCVSPRKFNPVELFDEIRRLRSI